MNNYIDLSYQDSSVLLNNNSILNNNIKDNSNLNNNDNIIEGFGNFGRVNLDKCCPLEYMWSEQQKKCVKICDGCAVGAYGDINYEFLTSNGEFMSFAVCKGDASGSYDFDKINRRYGVDELVTQHDLNYHIDSNEDEEGVQPAEEDPWAPVMGGMYQAGKKQQQMNIRQTGRWAGDDNTWNTYLDCNEDGECETREGTFTRMTDEQRYELLDEEFTLGDIQEQISIQNRILLNRTTICENFTSLTFSGDTEGTPLYQVCGNDVVNASDWDSVCSLPREGETLSFNMPADRLVSFCNEHSELCNSDNTSFLKNVICNTSTR